jgi:tetratricopeptide (TPR) repeat protein
MADARSLVAAAATAAQTASWDDALALARAALAVDPLHPRAWGLVGTALEAQGKHGEARTALEKAVSLDDRDLATAVACARVQAKTGAVTAARALLTYVLLRESGAPALRAEAYTLLHALDEGEARA